MPRLPDRVVSRLQPTSTQGARLSDSELASITNTEARAVATQAVDALENGAALVRLKTLLGGEPIPPPLSSLRDVPAGRAWLEGASRIGPGSSAADVKVLQRALMKIGAHHPQGRGDPSLLLLPYGADGSLGPGTLRALDAALRLANRADLTPSASRMPAGREVAQALESLLAQTPSIRAPATGTTPAYVPAAPSAGSTSTVPRRLDLLGGAALPLERTPYDARWNGLFSRIGAESSRYRVGTPGNSAAQNAWLRETDALRGKTPQEQLLGVNRIVNAMPFKSDTRDEWRTPLEFIQNGGDCEDFVMAKYQSLKRLGFDESRMRMLIVQDTVSRQPHAVLAVDMPDATYILDNQSQHVLRNEQLQLSAGWLYKPIFMLSRDKSWLFGVRANP